MIWFFVLALMCAIEAPGWLFMVLAACVFVKWLITFMGVDNEY